VGEIFSVGSPLHPDMSLSKVKTENISIVEDAASLTLCGV
jgi:hypothetical protein